VLNGRFNVSNLQTWDSRIEVVGVDGKEFEGLLHLDTLRTSQGITPVNAILRVRGKLDGRRGFEFTVTRIEKQSPRSDCFIDSNNIGIVYRGLVSGDRIVGRALPNADLAGGSMSFMFMHPKLSHPLVVQPSEKLSKVEDNTAAAVEPSSARRSRVDTRGRDVIGQPLVNNELPLANNELAEALDRWPD
jgi:hypothetical protein